MLFRTFSNLLKPPTIPPIPIHEFPRASVVRFKLQMPEEPKWITKHLSDLEICSRGQAERFLSAGMIKVDGSRALENQKILKSSKIEIVRRNDTNTQKLPITDEIKLWVFYKPQGFTTTLNDTLRRPTVYNYLAVTAFPRIEVWTIGHLDFYSEGIMLLTNSKDLAEATEFKMSHIKRKYELRVNGRVDTQLIENIKRGLQLSNKRFKPMQVWTRKDKPKSKNVWLGAVLESSHPRELRCIFERKRMHVNRLLRTHYGPYKLFGLMPGEFKEVDIHLHFHKLLFNYYKNKSLKQ